jgi:hypothetical protein
MNPTTPGDGRLTNSDLAFIGNYAIQGNYSGWQVWDISNPARPTLRKAYVCPGSQSDVSVYRNLLFVSGESTSGRLDCGTEGVQDSVSHHRLRGIRIFDITDWDNPRYIGNVQTCRGSHTHSVLVPPNDPNNIYICPAVPAWRRTRILTARCSASRSSRCRWPTRPRPASSARRAFSRTWSRRLVTATHRRTSRSASAASTPPGRLAQSSCRLTATHSRSADPALQ